MNEYATHGLNLRQPSRKSSCFLKRASAFLGVLCVKQRPGHKRLRNQRPPSTNASPINVPEFSTATCWNPKLNATLLDRL